MKFLFTSYVIFLVLQSCYTSDRHEYKSDVKFLSHDEFSKMIFRNTSEAGVETTVAKQLRDAIPPDDGSGNYGDLIHRSRQHGDTLILRDVIVLPLTTVVHDVHWFASTQASSISTVRVLNFGRDRAYVTRIDVVGNDAQSYFLVPPYYYPRIMIEVYGFY